MKLGPLFAEVLIADSDEAFARKCRTVLQSAGYAARMARSGAALLQALAARRPALLILGDNLEQPSSYDLARQVKTETGAAFLPIIFIASQRQDAEMARALNAGADDVLARPVGNAELLVHTRAMLRLKSTTDELAELNATLEQKVRERGEQLAQAQAQLMHAEKLSSLGRLAASIAHEINNPLTGILMYVRLVKEDLPADVPSQSDLALIERQVNVIGELVRNLRDFSRPPQKERRPVNLNDVVSEVLALTKKDLEQRRIQLIEDLAPDLEPVLASPEQLGEIFLNLVINARDAMPQGGQLTARSGTVNGCARVEIRDTGAGIAPEHLETIFEPFFTTKGEHGTGLGLSIAYRIIQDHGGDITVHSTPGEGSAFWVSIPNLERSQAGIACPKCKFNQTCLPAKQGVSHYVY